MELTPIIIKAVQEYQCPGCIIGYDVSCYKEGDYLECGKHISGTRVSNIGKIFLGMSKGFNRLGTQESTKINIFKTFGDGWGYTKFNIPVWKYLNENNHTIVRGICPRTNYAWIHIFLENCIGMIDCLEITQKDIDDMD